MPVKDASIQNPALSGGEVYTFNPKATEEEIKAAWDIIMFQAFDEEQCKVGWKRASELRLFDLNIPPRKDMLEKKLEFFDYMPQSVKNDLINASKVAKAEPFCPNWTDIKTALVKPLQQIILKEGISRDEVKMILEKCAEEIYRKYPESFKK
jgi:ABC-type glycerol-3-phosphate transport system substrate-binding protein